MPKIDSTIEMTFYPSENPGAHERHLIRRNENVLFGIRKTKVDSDSLQHCQKIDHDILQAYMIDFKALMSQVVNLKPNEESDVVLSIKNQLDKLYAVSVSVADDQSIIQESIKKLLNVVMQSVRKGAGQDQQAIQELDQEESAREAHFAFLESKLVADILDPESPIENQDLLPTLLSAEKDDLALSVQLFDNQQMIQLLNQGKALLDSLGKDGHEISGAAENYVFMEGYLAYLNQSN